MSEFLHNQGNYDISLICNDEEGVREDLPDYVHYYPVCLKRGISLSIFKTMNQIEKILKENQFDIVQYSTPNAAFCASIAAKRAKTPVRLYCQWGIRYMGFGGWKRALFKWLEKATCKNSTFIEAESHNIRQFSIEEKLYEEEKSCVIWNGSACGVNLSKFDNNQRELWRNAKREEFGFKETDVVFSFAARLTADKGVNELLAAFKELEGRYDNAKLLVMGGNDNVESINPELLDYAKNSFNIIFTGRVNDVEKFYAASDIFVAPSYREGFGLVVIEAAAMGLPAIVSNVPGQVDAIDEGKTGITCEVKSSESLYNAMEKMLIDEDMRIMMAENAARYVFENYEQQALFEKLSAHRQALCGQREV
ncbi:MAG: glycosyltransferase [Clostridia bacterium]|nr:glycosyltransferase [Clostridia bacterium]